MTTINQSIAEYRTIYRSAQEDRVSVTGLKGTMEEMEATLVERISKKRGYKMTRGQILAEME